MTKGYPLRLEGFQAPLDRHWSVPEAPNIIRLFVEFGESEYAPPSQHSTLFLPFLIRPDAPHGAAGVFQFVTEPVLVLADEPTGELDTENTKRIMELMRELNRELDQTFAIVTHDPMVADYTRRRVILRDGKVEKDQLSEGTE